MEEAAKILIIEALDKISAGDINPQKQDPDGATYARILKKEMGALDYTKEAAELERLVRAFTPWPGTYTHLNGRILKVLKASVADKDELVSRCADAVTDAPKGSIAGVSDSAVYVQTGRDYLKFETVQLEGKKRMSVSDFLRGCPLRAGDKLA